MFSTFSAFHFSSKQRRKQTYNIVVSVCNTKNNTNTAGESKYIKILHRLNQLLIEVSRKVYGTNLLRAQTSHDLQVRYYPHTSLNSSKGVICCPKLGNCSKEETLEGTKSQGVTKVKRFKVKRNGEIKDTNTFVFTINTPVLSNSQSGIL